MGLNRISVRLRGGNSRQRQMGIGMSGLGHIGWRVAAVIVAFAGTAALAVTLTRVPEHPHAALSANISCSTSGLRASLGRAGTISTGTRAAGGSYYTLEFTNISHQVCSLFGYPEVSAFVTSQTGRLLAAEPGERERLPAYGAVVDAVFHLDSGDGQIVGDRQIQAEGVGG